MQVLSHIAARLSKLHAAGYVHRDIKPAHIMWLPRKKRWTLIDFGCAARDGEVAKVKPGLTYSAPEVVRARVRGASQVRVSKAEEAWAVGMVALEMVSGQPVFDPATPPEQVRSLKLRPHCLTYTCACPACTGSAQPVCESP
jgi:serine/threonine protein kinase